MPHSFPWTRRPIKSDIRENFLQISRTDSTSFYKSMSWPNWTFHKKFFYLFRFWIHHHLVIASPSQSTVTLLSVFKYQNSDLSENGSIGQWKPFTWVGISKLGFTSSNFTSFVKAFRGFLEMPIVDSDWPVSDCPDFARLAFLFGSRNNKSEGRSDWKNSCGGIKSGTFSREKYFVRRSSADWSSRESEIIISSRLFTFNGSFHRCTLIQFQKSSSSGNLPFLRVFKNCISVRLQSGSKRSFLVDQNGPALIVRFHLGFQ